MNVFIFIADAWGALKGGINCFNYDLSIACAHISKETKDTIICCVVPDLSEEERSNIRSHGIIPITLSKLSFDSPEAARYIVEKIQNNRKLRHYFPKKCNTFCIGHDIYTGALSKSIADECNGWNIVFHHMDYSSYYLFKNPNAGIYTQKIESQKNILRDADLVCAVGPKLLISAKGIVRAKGIQTMEVIPGIADFEAVEETDWRFNPIVFGRVEEDNQRVKQTALAVDAFAKALAQDDSINIIGDDAQLKVVGYENCNSDSLKEEVKRLQSGAEEIAGRLCNIVPIPYQADRTALGELISEASVAMMLSFHEGFGLVGYEAIAAGIPLILSENSGLYNFLQSKHLHSMVYPVKIKGATNSKGYSEDDLNTVARALREIKKDEEEFKKNALELRRILRNQENEYSWHSIAKRFIDGVFKQFDSELENEATVFYHPEQVTKLSPISTKSISIATDIELSSDNHVYSVEGKDALLYLCKKLQKGISGNYSTLVYNVESGTEYDSAYPDFISNCRSFFGKEKDYKGREFQYVLAERLDETILILNDFSTTLHTEFCNLFELLNNSTYNFYLFTVFETESPITIKPYSKQDIPSIYTSFTDPKPLPIELTSEQKLLAKILFYRGKAGYSKKLIHHICNGINRYCDAKNTLHIFESVVETEEALKKCGIIEEFSEFSYQNSTAYLTNTTDFEVDCDAYAIGVYAMGRFYARCYHLNKSRDPQLPWGYFSCKCFAFAAEMSSEIKNEIKTDYESILIDMRKKAMDTSDYARYHHSLQRFLDVYERPDNLWIWYNYIHCESICCPQESTLEKTKLILNQGIPVANLSKSAKSELLIQFIRLCAELEHEFDNPNSLCNLLKHLEMLSPDSKVGTSWAQCLSSLINIATDQKAYDCAEKHLGEYKKLAKSNNGYHQVIAIALETNLIIAQHKKYGNKSLLKILPSIEEAFHLAKNKLKDYRAQGWTLGLWGECQILLDNQMGQVSLRKSMECRRQSGEKSKEYKNWLRRISNYNLQPNIRALLDEEISRTKT